MRGSKYGNRKAELDAEGNKIPNKASLAFDSIEQAELFVKGDSATLKEARKAVKDALQGED